MKCRFLWKKLIITIVMVFLFIWTFAPYFSVILASFTPEDELMRIPRPLFPSRITLENYEALLSPSSRQSTYFVRCVLNTIIVGLATSTITILFAALGGYALSRLNFSFKNIIFYVILATLPIPTIACMIPLYWMFRQMQLIDTYQGLILIYLSAFVPFSLWMMKNYFDSIPSEVEESALIDGCSRAEVLFRITLPLSLPAITTLFILNFLNVWGEFMIAVVFTESYKAKTLTVLVSEFTRKYYSAHGLRAAASILGAIPPLIITYLFQKHIIGGLVKGAIKG